MTQADTSSTPRSPLEQSSVQVTLAVIGMALVVIQSAMIPLVRPPTVRVNRGGDVDRGSARTSLTADGPQVADQHTSDPVADAAPLLQIDLNLAPRRELALLPHVGPVLADRIVRDREANGRFTTVSDLTRVRGVGPITIAAAERFCVVGEASESTMLAESPGKP